MLTDVDTLKLNDVDVKVLVDVLTDVETLEETLELSDVDVETLVLALEYVE